MRLAQVVRATVVGAAGIVFWGMAPGCGPSVGAYCNKVCDCTGCSDSEVDDCVDSTDDARKAAGEAGCGSEFDAALRCAASELSCEDARVQTDGCEEENEALYECTPDVIGPGGNACDVYVSKIVARYQACGVEIDTEPEESAECTTAIAEQARCLSPCIELLDCVCINGTGGCTSEVIAPYGDCVQACGI